LVLTVDASNPELSVIREAAAMIRDGLVVAYPTDTLYGLAVDPRNATAVRRLFELKGRPETSALTLIAADGAQAWMAGERSAAADQLARQWWPGPLTLVVRARAGLAKETLAGGLTVGVRVPDQAVARALAVATGFCITATSANRSGEAAASDAEAVAAALPEVDAILDGGPSRGGPPSTIVNASERELTLIRAGAVPWNRVLRSLSSGA
jgi:L-threonylcarbamoyladenylate synthase